MDCLEGNVKRHVKEKLILILLISNPGSSEILKIKVLNFKLGS